jgi:hypothetical protein
MIFFIKRLYWTIKLWRTTYIDIMSGYTRKRTLKDAWEHSDLQAQ